MGDILERIDGVLDQTAGPTCACGCGELLPLDSPSAYWLDAEHQQRWHTPHVTDPESVYDGKDASTTYVSKMRWRG